MKEANPISLRYGISNTRSGIIGIEYSIFITKSRIELFFYKLFLSVMESSFYYSIISPVIIPINGKLVLYFYYYVTQFTERRLRVRKRRKIRRTQDGIILISQRAILNKRFNSFKITNISSLRALLCYGYNNKQYTGVLLSNQPKKLTRFRKKINTSIPKLLIGVRRMLNFKRILEKLIFKCLGYQGRCFFKNIYTIFDTKQAKPIIYRVYLIYKRFPYYKRTTYFVDSVNLLFYTIYCRSPNLLISFMCRELERTTLHNRFLKMMKQIMSEFYERLPIFEALKFLIKGPVNRHGRTKKLTYVFGSVPCQTFTKDVTYYNFFSNTRFGTVGMRLWIY
jgi:hypothetical protein